MATTSIESSKKNNAATTNRPKTYALLAGSLVMSQSAIAAIVNQPESDVSQSQSLIDKGSWPVHTTNVSLEGVGETSKLFASLERNEALQLRQVIDTEAVLIAREQPAEPLHSAVSVVAVALLAVVALARRYS